MKVKTKYQCPRCDDWFSARGGNYKRHANVCDGSRKRIGKRGECEHCSERFDLSDKPKGWMANHSRWCKKNPKRAYYIGAVLGHARTKMSKKSIDRMREGIRKAHADGRYKDAPQKRYQSKVRNGTLAHSEETKNKIRQKALDSKHRRLKKGIVEYKGVLLDSSWELALAQRLDEQSIIWIRPNPIPWTDENGDIHNYFPDFYLPDHDMYLDPKNPHAVKVQEYKLKMLLTQYSNIYIIDSLEGCESFSV